jgi:hypothetical protein
LADEIEINDVALSVGARKTEPGIGAASGGEQCSPEFFRVGFPDSEDANTRVL